MSSILAKPTPSAFSAMAYYPGTTSLVLLDTASFPAFVQEPTVQIFTWNGSAWTLQLAGLAQNPAPRTQCSMAYDGTSLVAFGGAGPDGTDFRNDTLTYNGSSWTTVLPNYNHVGLVKAIVSTTVNTSVYPNKVVNTGTTLPGLVIRAGSYMAQTSTGIVLHGGFDRHFIYQDTYTWSHGSQTWTQVFPATVPPIRKGAAFASNGTNNAILFGGCNESTMMNDVYSWNGSNWSKLVANYTKGSPSVRQNCAMAYYPTGGYWLLFGGSDTSGDLLNQTWKFDGSSVWTQLFPATSPSTREGASMAFDTSSGQMILFGGRNSKLLLGDTWNWSGGNWVLLSNPI